MQFANARSLARLLSCADYGREICVKFAVMAKDDEQGILWRLPKVHSKGGGKLGPAFGYGIGCGIGLGAGIVGDSLIFTLGVPLMRVHIACVVFAGAVSVKRPVVFTIRSMKVSYDHYVAPKERVCSTAIVEFIDRVLIRINC